MKKVFVIMYIIIELFGVLISKPCFAENRVKKYQHHIILMIDSSGSMVERGSIKNNLELLITQDLKEIIFEKLSYQNDSYLSTFQFGMPKHAPDFFTNFILPIHRFSGNNVSSDDLDDLYRSLQFDREYTGWMAALRLAMYEARNQFQGGCDSTYIILISDMEYSLQDQKDSIEEFLYFERMGVNNINKARKIYDDIGDLYKFSEQQISRKRVKSKTDNKYYFLKAFQAIPKAHSPESMSDLGIPSIIQLKIENDGVLYGKLGISSESFPHYKIKSVRVKVANTITRELVSDNTLLINASAGEIPLQLKSSLMEHAKDFVVEISGVLVYSDPYYGKQLKEFITSGIPFEMPSYNLSQEDIEQPIDDKIDFPREQVIIDFYFYIGCVIVLVGIVVAILIFRGRKKKIWIADKNNKVKPIIPIKFEIGLDRMTFFPCIKSAGSQWFHLLPVTKLQVEQWIYEGGRENDTPESISAMIKRLENPSVTDGYPETVRGIQRVAINDIGPKSVQSVIATNLKLWSSREELMQASEVHFPVAGSEWGNFVEWLHASIPGESEAKRWRKHFANISSQELLRKIVRAIPTGRLPQSVERLLKNLADGMDPSVRGLPFSDNGVWELVDKPVQRKYLSQGGSGSTIYYPTTIGRTTLWPYIETGGKEHVVLQPALPMVGLRLIPQDVDALDITLEISPLPHPTQRMPKNTSGQIEAKKKIVSQKPATTVVKGKTTMTKRCPLCYKVIEEKLVWESRGNIWCALVKRKTNGETRTDRVHTASKPSQQKGRNWVVLSEEMLNNDYRRIATRKPFLVRPLTLSGYTQNGKSCCLLSLTGTLLYPDGNNMFSRFFPREMDFIHLIGAMSGFNSDDRLNIFHNLEFMRIDGNLPLPTSIEKALSSPLIFSLPNKNLVILVNDIAGEVMGPNLAQYDEFPHVACSNDIVYLIDARELQNCFLQFERVVAGIGAAEFEGDCINPKQLNLIIAISKIDRPDIDEELADICLQKPYILPQNHKYDELVDYLDVMKKVNHDIRMYLMERFPNLVTLAEKSFGSVRYCGFSSFGHHPLPKDFAEDPNSHGCLVAEPQPVRVVDPLLWILLEQGLLKV